MVALPFQTKERIVLASTLVLISILVIIDLSTDSKEGVALWHVVAEGAIALVSLIGVFYILKDIFKIKKTLSEERAEFQKFKIEIDEYKKNVELWKSESKKYLDGLSMAIDLQLDRWHLTTAEKEVAFLLLKGLSSKEIAEIRHTTEKTVRMQSTSIYAKSGVAGRSELSAFFLEDLLLPQKTDRLNS